MVDNTFFRKRMILCQHRELAQYPSGLPHDQSYKTQRDAEVEEVHWYVARGDMLAREHHLIIIQPVTKEQKYGHKGYRTPVPLGTPRHVDKEGAYKVDYQIQIEDPFIGALEPRFEINSFFRNVRVPDEHELVKPQVGPEDGECELELPEVVQVLLVDVFEITLVLDVDDENGQQRQTGDEAAAEIIPAVHRRKPVGVDAHEPYPGRDGGDGQRIPDDIERRPDRILKHIFSSLLYIQWGVVDAAGYLAKLPAKKGPQSYGEDRPGSKKAGAEETAFPLQDMVFGHDILIQPFVYIGMSAENQDHEDDEGNGADGNDAGGERFGHAAKRQLKTSESQRCGGEKEHNRIDGKQPENAIVQDGGPEPGTLVMTAVQDKTDDQG